MLDSLEVADGLIRFGFRLVKDKVRAKKFVHADLAHPVYVKTAPKRGRPVFKMPLVIHPALVSVIKRTKSNPEQVNESWNNSNLIEFPKAVNNKGNMQHYGVAIDVSDLDELKIVVDSLLSRQERSYQVPDNQSSYDSESHGHTAETEVESSYRARRGQDIFRAKLLSYWGEKCAVTGIAVPQILKSSHIKPWRSSDNTERLDVYNGLLLSPNLDSLFDQGLITFSRDGKLLWSDKIAGYAVELGLTENMYLTQIDDDHLGYLKWHRENIFVNK